MTRGMEAIASVASGKFQAFAIISLVASGYLPKCCKPCDGELQTTSYINPIHQTA